MMSVDITTCPNCGGAIPREHSAEVRYPHSTDYWIYCEHCEIGWEIALCADGEFFPVDYHARTEPVNFGRFLQRLEDAKAA